MIMSNLSNKTTVYDLKKLNYLKTILKNGGGEKKTINASSCSGHVFINSMSLNKPKSVNCAIFRD